MQTLSWQVGDRYRCEDGTVMTIDLIANKALSCLDGDNVRHLFDIWYGTSACIGCTHGHLVNLITGSVI